MTKSRAMRDETPVDPRFDHPTKSPEARAINDIREDVERGFAVTEARSGYPLLDWVDGGAPAALGGDMVLKGRNLLQGQSFASLTLGTGTAELVFTALKPGEDGNLFTIAIVDGETAGSEVVTKTGNAFVIGIESGVSSADQIATAVNANGADSDGYLRCNGGGAGTPADVAATALTGGEGEGFQCLVSGVEALPANTTGSNGAAAITDTAATVTVPDLTAEGDARAAADLVAITVESDGVMSNGLTAALA